MLEVPTKKKSGWTKKCDAVWEINTKFNSEGRSSISGWATQKPVALYSRMIEAATNAGDLVLDSFCGCVTTLVAAENAGRQWVGIDRHPEAKKQVVSQLGKLNERSEDWLRKVIIRDDVPVRTDLGKLPHYKKHFDNLYTRQNGVCAGCGERRDKIVCQVDHKAPKSRGGQDDFSNLNLLCPRCNAIKGARSMAWLKRNSEGDEK